MRDEGTYFNYFVTTRRGAFNIIEGADWSIELPSGERNRLAGKREVASQRIMRALLSCQLFLGTDITAADSDGGWFLYVRNRTRAAGGSRVYTQ